MKRLAGWIWVCLGIFAASCSRPSETPEQRYSKALAAFLHGNLPEAMRAAEQGATQNSDHNSAIFWNFRLLEAEALLGQGENQKAYDLVSKPGPKLDGMGQLEVRRLIDFAHALTRLGQSANALEVLDLAQAKVQDEELRIRILVLQGNIFDRVEKHDLAVHKMIEARDLATKQGNDYQLAQTLLNLGQFKKEENEYSAALDLDGQALGLAKKSGADRITAGELLNLGYLEAFFGEFDRAVQYEQNAVAIFTRIGDRPLRMDALGELGLVLSIRGETEQAIQWYRQAFDLAKGNDPERSSRFAGNLALAYIKLKNWDKASEWNSTAASIHIASSRPYEMMNQASIELGRGRTDEFFVLCKKVLEARGVEPDLLWGAHEEMAGAYAGRSDFKNAGLEYRRALDMVERTRSEMQTDDSFKITFLSRLIRLYQEYVETLVRDNRMDEAFQVIESSRARVLAEQFAGSGVASTKRAAPSSNAVILSFWIAPERSFVWLISREGKLRFDLPPGEKITEAVTAYKALTEKALKNPLLASSGTASPLWSMLLEQAAPHIAKGSRVVVIPDGPLHQLNLETLVVPGPHPHYWLEDVEVAIAPSLSLAPSFAADKPQGKGAGPLVMLIGAPDYSGTQYPALRYADRELKGIQAKFPSPPPAVFAGLRATPAAYRSAGPEKFAVIHFAAHAVANQESPLESAVILSRSGEDYRLYARDIFKIPIHADLVTVSACRSAGARAYEGEGLIGFAWAFLGAGARNVIGGLWDVDDESTSELMSELYAGIAAGLGPVRALHLAKLRLMKDYPKPYYWGPFQVYSAAK